MRTETMNDIRVRMMHIDNSLNRIMEILQRFLELYEIEQGVRRGH